MINNTQKIYLEIIRQTQFNELDGEQVYNSLIENKDLWIACVLGRFVYSPLILLRDIPEDIHNIDTLYVTTTKENLAKLILLANTWCADEIDEVPREEAKELMGHMGLSFSQTLLRVWWD